MANSSQPHGISDGSCLNGGRTFPGRGSCSSVARSRSRSRFFSERPQPRLLLPKPTSPRLLLLRTDFDSPFAHLARNYRGGSASAPLLPLSWLFFSSQLA